MSALDNTPPLLTADVFYGRPLRYILDSLFTLFCAVGGKICHYPFNIFTIYNNIYNTTNYYFSSSDVVLKTGLGLKTIFLRSWSWPWS